jgi:phage/plasmid-like protein (TIGR03299 family)
MKSVYDYLPAINANTAEEMAEQAGLDFTAVKVDIKYTYVQKTEEVDSGYLNFIKGLMEDGSKESIAEAETLLSNADRMNVTKEIEAVVPDKVAVIREDDGRYLGTVGRERGLLQYKDMLAFTGALVSEGTASYVTGGITGNGEQAFVVMKTNNAIKLSGTDDVECYFYVTTSHDSSKGLSLVLAPLRSTNGTVLSTPKSYRLSFRHSSRVEDRVKRATLSVKKLNTYFEEMETSFRLLRSVNITRDQFNVFVKSLFPDPEERTKQTENIRDEITGIYNSGPACQLPSTKGTMLGAYMAVVEWVDKIRNVKSSKVRPNEYDAKLHSLLEGSGAQQKADAYAFALDMVEQLKNVSLAGSMV